MVTVRQIIDMYEGKGDKVRYDKCTEADVRAYLSEEVIVLSGDVPRGSFGNGHSRHLYLANSQVFVGKGSRTLHIRKRDFSAPIRT